jgi:hypothetical protein
VGGYRVNPDSVEWRAVDEEAVIIHLPSSRYFGLNPSGTWIWSTLATQACTSDQVASHLAARYRLLPDQARGEVATFLRQLVQAELIGEVAAGDGAEIATVAATSASDEYEAPELVTFGDLDTLILSAE